VEVENGKVQVAFELNPINGKDEGGYPIKKKRLLVGRSKACDIVLDHDDITAIHAVIEVTKSGNKIYDMNSTNGTFVNGKSVVVEEFKLGDELRFGSNLYTFKEYSKEDILPPPLAMLDDGLPPVIDESPRLPKPPSEVEARETAEYVPVVEYPLARDPNAEFSEYIFEDSDKLYPIFKYDVSKSSVEIIVLFKDRVYSVDFLPDRDGIYNLVGFQPDESDVEYSYLGKDEKVPLVKMTNGHSIVFPIPGYEMQSLSDNEISTNSSEIELHRDDILRFQNGDLQVFVRGDEAPPKVAPAPMLRRDSGDLKKYFLLMLLLVTFVMGSLTFIEVDEEIEKEKVPDRIAKILYKKKFKAKKSPAIDKTKNKPKEKVQKSNTLAQKNSSTQQKKVVVDKSKVKVGTKGSKSAKKTGLVKKASPNKGKKDNLVDKVTPKKKSGSGKPRSTNKPAKVTAKSKSKGRVDTYKSFNFKSTVSSLLSKGGATSTFKAQSNSASVSDSSSVDSGDTDGATLKKATVSNNVGSLSGSAQGKLDSSKGVEGLVDKKNIYTAGLPFKTVILGGMDPDIIRKIIEDHIPQFRYCYQKELDKAAREFSGVVRLNFIIGASGHVTKAGVDSFSPLPVRVKGCVVNVLKGIKFPEPLGGGVVEVNQPFNFYPKRK
jgi:hypothetical protein